MIIEIIGLPGSGKTSIVEILKKKYKNKIDFYQSGDKKNIKCYFTSFNFLIKLIFKFPILFFNSHKSFNWLIHKLLYRVCSYNIEESNRNYLLYDSGVLMPMVSFYIQRNEYKINLDYGKLFNLLPRPDLIIFVDTEIDIVLKRYQRRGGYRTGNKGSKRVKINSLDEIENKFRDGEIFVTRLIDYYNNLGIKIIKISNNSSKLELEKCLKKLDIDQFLF